MEPDPSSNIPRAGSSEFLSYDRALNRWVLATWNHISPDGRRAVVQGQNGDLDIVDVASGAARPIGLPAVHGQWLVIDYTIGGIYLTLMAGLDYADPGLWVVNPDSRQVRKLDGTQFWSEVDDRGAWGVAIGPSTRELRRLDLQTGAITTYLSVPYHQPLQPGDRSLQLISLNTDGRPLILERDWRHPFPWYLAVVSAPNMPLALEMPTK
jgi:hypothetical protein